MPTRQGGRAALKSKFHDTEVIKTADKMERLLLRVIDGALAAAVCGLPFLMGGRCAAGAFALAVIAAVAVLAVGGLAAVRPSLGRWPAVGLGLVAAGVALLIVQIAPWPQAVLERIAPHLRDVLPLLNSETAARLGLERWETVSLAPVETRAALVVFLSYAILFLAAAVRVRRVEHIERILGWCAVSGAVMAVFGLVQFIFSNEKFFWVYAHPFSNTADAIKGSFTNRNHFAGFLALAIGPLLWQLVELDLLRRKPESAPFAPPKDLRTWLRALMLGIVGAVVALSLSRGGMIAAGIALAAGILLLLRVQGRSRRMLWGLGGVGGLTLAAWIICGGRALDARMETIASGSVESLDPESGRRIVWAGVIQGIPAFLPFGSGAGSFRAVAPMIVDDPVGDRYEYTHAESSYLQIALENGVIGLLLAFFGVALVAGWCWEGFRRNESLRTKACIAAMAASFLAFAVHGATDIVWHVPACTATIAILAGCAWGASRFQAGPLEPAAGSHGALRKWGRWGGLAAATCLGGFLLANRWTPLFSEPRMEEYLRQRQADSRDHSSGETISLALKRIELLAAAADCDPDNAAAHAALAEEHLAAFERIQRESANAMTLRNIRDAAVRSRFPSPNTLDAWLTRAVGANRTHLDEALHHARAAARLAPLEGRAYACLAQVAFLESPSNPDADSLYDQALIVRPHAGNIFYAAASEAAFRGDSSRWAALAAGLCRCGATWRDRLMRDLFRGVPSEAIPRLAREFVDQFPLDLDGLRLLSRLCRGAAADEALAFLDRRYAEAAVLAARGRDDAQAAPVWLEAEGCYTRLGQGPLAVECARRAYAATPENFEVRRRLGFALAGQGAWEEAEGHLRWCAERRPRDALLQAKFKEAMAKRFDCGTAAQQNRPLPR